MEEQIQIIEKILNDLKTIVQIQQIYNLLIACQYTHSLYEIIVYKVYIRIECNTLYNNNTQYNTVF